MILIKHGLSTPAGVIILDKLSKEQSDACLTKVAASILEQGVGAKSTKVKLANLQPNQMKVNLPCWE